MKIQWNNLTNAIGEHLDNMQMFIDNVTDPLTKKNLKSLVSGLNKIMMLCEEFDKLVDPITPKKVDLPFPSESFSEEWIFYKEYLMEQYGAYIPSRVEIKMLKKLKSWSGNNEAKAIEILEYMIINRSYKFYGPTEKQLSGEDIPSEEGGIPSGMDLNILSKKH